MQKNKHLSALHELHDQWKKIYMVGVRKREDNRDDWQRWLINQQLKCLGDRVEEIIQRTPRKQSSAVIEAFNIYEIEQSPHEANKLYQERYTLREALAHAISQSSYTDWVSKASISEVSINKGLVTLMHANQQKSSAKSKLIGGYVYSSNLVMEQCAKSIMCVVNLLKHYPEKNNKDKCFKQIMLRCLRQQDKADANCHLSCFNLVLYYFMKIMGYGNGLFASAISILSAGIYATGATLYYLFGITALPQVVTYFLAACFFYAGLMSSLLFTFRVVTKGMTKVVGFIERLMLGVKSRLYTINASHVFSILVGSGMGLLATILGRANALHLIHGVRKTIFTKALADVFAGTLFGNWLSGLSQSYSMWLAGVNMFFTIIFASCMYTFQSLKRYGSFEFNVRNIIQSLPSMSKSVCKINVQKFIALVGAGVSAFMYYGYSLALPLSMTMSAGLSLVCFFVWLATFTNAVEDKNLELKDESHAINSGISCKKSASLPQPSAHIQKPLSRQRAGGRMQNRWSKQNGTSSRKNSFAV